MLIFENGILGEKIGVGILGQAYHITGTRNGISRVVLVFVEQSGDRGQIWIRRIRTGIGNQIVGWIISGVVWGVIQSCSILFGIGFVSPSPKTENRENMRVVSGMKRHRSILKKMHHLSDVNIRLTAKSNIIWPKESRIR